MESRVDEHVVSIAHRELKRLQITASAGGGIEDARRQLAEAEQALDAYLDAISPEDVGPEAFSRAARKKRAAVDMARAEMHAALARSRLSRLLAIRARSGPICGRKNVTPFYVACSLR